MSKISLIIKREYQTRVRKKSFIIMSILGPILMAAIIVVPVLLTQMGSDETKKIAVADYTGSFLDVFKDSEKFDFEYISKDSVGNIKQDFENSGYYALIVLPDSSGNENIQLISDVTTDIGTKNMVSGIMKEELHSRKLVELGIDKARLDSANVDVKIETIKLKEDGKGEESSPEVIMILGIMIALTIYMFIFIYGSQVMRGVLEEKTNRVVEVLVSSVKPFQLMMGKIVGVALVAITQVALWAVFTTIIVSVALPMVGIDASSQAATEQIVQGAGGIPPEVQNVNQGNDFLFTALNTLSTIPLGQIIFSFIVYFIGGYLLYSSLFAAIGGAVDNETDSQQFMLPVTVPLILSIVMAQVVIQNPNGALAFWLSIIPFTSPVIMLLRIPFGVPGWELALSMLLLVATFIGTTWLAGKIYRVGILMYGKKISYKELWRWIRYSN